MGAGKRKRVCPNCQIEKVFSQHALWCSRCTNTYRTQIYSSLYDPASEHRTITPNPVHPFALKIDGWKTFHQVGLTAKQVKALRATHDGKCDICGKTELDNGQKLNLDHDHVTGQFRGFLCSKCNWGLGSFEDNIECLEKAAEYLRNAKRRVKVS